MRIATVVSVSSADPRQPVHPVSCCWMRVGRGRWRTAQESLAVGTELRRGCGARVSGQLAWQGRETGHLRQREPALEARILSAQVLHRLVALAIPSNERRKVRTRVGFGGAGAVGRTLRRAASAARSAGSLPLPPSAEVGSVPERLRLEPPVVTAESVGVDVPLRRPAAALPAVASAGMPGWHACAKR